MVEGAFERPSGGGAPSGAPATTPCGAVGLVLLFLLGGGGSFGGGCRGNLLLGLLARGFFSCARLLLDAASGLFFKFGSNQRVVFRAQIDLLGASTILVAIRL
jgi:hypothetical protein